MMADLFPSIPGAMSPMEGQSLPVCREIKFDFDRRRPVFDRGQPVTVTESEAVRVWAWHALQAERYRHEHESWRYGCELYRLRGLPYQPGTIEAEAKRSVVEALTVCPYITAAEVTEMELVEDTLRFAVRYTDIYGGGDVIHV